MTAVRVFLDANVIVSGLLFEGKEAELLRPGAVRAFEMVTTSEVLEEVRFALGRDEFGLDSEDVDDLMSYLQECVLILGRPRVNAVRKVSQLLEDAKDAHVWAGFELSVAKYLATGDRELLKKVGRAVKTTEILKFFEELSR